MANPSPIVRLAFGGLALVLVSCAQAPAPRADSGASTGQSAPQAPKVLTMAISAPPAAFSIVGGSVPAGGWVQITEMHSDGLITSQPGSRQPIGRLAENVPSVEDGTLTILPDGRMREVFRLRNGVTWHDGAPFTAHDLVFSFKLGGPGGIPTSFNEPMRRMESVEAQDDHTVVMLYRAPYYRAVGLGPHAFWPLPRHILGEAYERYAQTGNIDDILAQRYWSTEYVHLGPFQATAFSPGDRISFKAYDGYFLGRPKLDTIHVLVIGEQNTLLSNLLAGTVQVAPASSLVAEAGLEAKQLWDASGQGIVHVKSSSIRLFEPQWSPAIQMEPTVLDARVRRAFYHSLDREALAEVLVGSGDRAAWAVLEDDDPLFPAVKDGLRQFTYDLTRARALLTEVGWTPVGDGSWRHSSDGRTFRSAIWGTPGRDQEMHLYGSYIRAFGIDVEEYMTPPTRYRDNEARSQFPGWDFTGTNITKMMTDPAASAANNWTGNINRYENAQARRLVDALETTVVADRQAQAMKAISDFVVAELPALPIFFLVQYTAVQKGVRAFDDLSGADGSERQYGGYARNAHIWDMQ